MGRRKGYDRDELIDRAVDVFRDHGFSETSADMLSKALGVNRFGIYSEFGGKQGLFDAALNRYNEANIERNFGPLEAAGSGIEQVRELFMSLGVAESSPAFGRGCLLCNTAVELGKDDPSGAGAVQVYFDRISRAFGTALRNASLRGEIDHQTDIKAEAAFFTASVLGLFVMLRARAPAGLIKNAAQMAIEHTNGMGVSSGT